MRELAQVVADLQRLNADQDRIRKNLRETPKEAEVYETYLKKLVRPGEGDRRADRQAEEAHDRRVRRPQEVRGLPRQHLRLSRACFACSQYANPSLIRQVG